MKYDLHIHTTCSDGKYSKIKLLKYFNNCNYDLVSFADHNFIDLNSEADLNKIYYETYGVSQNVSIVNAIEFDVDENSSLHILGYDIRNKKKIKEIMDYVRKVNTEIVEKIIKKIFDVYGIEIPIQLLKNDSNEGYLTKSDITQWMVNNGYAKDYIEAGILYTSKYSPCFEKRYSLPMVEVLSLINECGGLSFLAHPSSIKYSDCDLYNLVKKLVDNGLSGIEINNLDKTTIRQIEFYKELAREFNLLKSGGSDFHSEDSTPKIGLEDEEIMDFVNVLKRRKKYEL